MPPNSPDNPQSVGGAVAARPAAVEVGRPAEVAPGDKRGAELPQPVIDPTDKEAISQEAIQGTVPQGSSRKALESITRLFKGEKKTPIDVKIKREILKLKKSSDIKDKALGYDFDIAQQQAELSNIDALKKVLATPDLPAENKTYYEAELKRLEDSKVSQVDIDKLREERKKTVADEPDELSALAQKLGVDEKNPLQSVFDRLQTVAKNPKGDQVYFQGLKDKGFSDDEIKEIKEAVRLLRGEKTLAEKVAGKVIKGGGGLGATMLLMMWAASKKKEGGGGMG